MKKFFALLALAALLLTAFAFPVLAEEPILGGWSAYTDNPTENSHRSAGRAECGAGWP